MSASLIICYDGLKVRGDEGAQSQGGNIRPVDPILSSHRDDYWLRRVVLYSKRETLSLCGRTVRIDFTFASSIALPCLEYKQVHDSDPRPEG